MPGVGKPPGTGCARASGALRQLDQLVDVNLAAHVGLLGLPVRIARSATFHLRAVPRLVDSASTARLLDRRDRVSLSTPLGPGRTGRVPVSVATRWLVAGA